jgi:hypothetical protein
MKTNWIASKTASLLSPIMAVVFVLLTGGCEDAVYEIFTHALNNDSQESGITESLQNEMFIVDPAGTFITALEGTVQLYFFEGAVPAPTRFNISSFSMNNLDMKGYNMQKLGMLIECTSNEKTFNNMVRIWLNYDLDQFQAGALQKEDPLTIYSIDPGTSDDTRIESIGNCYKDFSYQKIKGYISRCGYYVVGENQ